MKVRQIFGLLFLIILVWLFKFLLGEVFSDFLCSLKIGDWCRIVNETTRFLGIFVFPFLLSVLFLYYWRKYRKNYEVISQWVLGVIIVIAIWSSLDGMFWVLPNLHDFFIEYYLLDIFTFFTLLEVYFSFSLILLLISLIFFAFGKK